MVKGPGSNSTVDTKLVIPVINGQPVCMLQDSKHALKTMRNNLFSGARLLVFGNYTATYSRIREIALEEDFPLYIRDVVKLDRQDDNAATRLFSAETYNISLTNIRNTSVKLSICSFSENSLTLTKTAPSLMSSR